jgi:predicted Zn-dependent peptidase
MIGSFALGGDDQSLLFQAIRMQLGASYSMGAGLDNFARKARILVMSGEVETASLAAAKEAALAAYAQMQTAPISPELLNRLRSPILEGLKGAIESDSYAMANGMLEALMDGSDPLIVQRLPALFEAVSQDSIMSRYAKDYPNIDDVWVVAVSSDPNALPGACVIKIPRDVFACP